MSVFASYERKAYPFTFSAEIHVRRLVGGTPSDPKVAEGWLKKKFADDEALLQQAVAEVMAERAIDPEQAIEEVAKLKCLNGFKRDENGLYEEGRHIKACIKEASNIRWPYPLGWNTKGQLTKAGTVKGEGRIKPSSSFFAEHVFVLEDRIPLGTFEPTDVMQRFVHTWRGNSISYDEHVDDVKIPFTVASDIEFTDEQWALLWLTAEQNGLGANRSQGYGRFEVTRWERTR